MNHTKYVHRAITLLLVTLVLAGCATPATAPAALPTAAPCPTSAPQSCPTAAALAVPTPDAWRKTYTTEYVNVRITFDPGKKCSLDILKPTHSPEFAYEVIVNDAAFTNYMVGAVTLAEGKTLKDLEKYDQSAKGIVPPPSYATIKLLDVVPPMSSTWHGATLPVGDVYFICFIEGPDPQQPFEEFGPVKIQP